MATAGTNWRLANSLITLRNQINTTYPNRNKASDGTVGDLAHQAQGAASEHNPNEAGVVCAFDITNSPDQGLDVQKLADSIAASRDARIKYMIFNDRIMIPTDYGWVWRFHYAGSHRQHLHVSVWGNYDDTTNWNIGDNDMADKVNLDTARILAHMSLARDGYDGRPSAHAGQSDADLNANHVGQELTNQYIRDNFFVSAEASNAFNIKDGMYKERTSYRQQIEQLKSELAVAKAQAAAAVQPAPSLDIIPSAQTPAETTPTQEPIDTKKVNWLVQLMINLFSKKSV